MMKPMDNSVLNRCRAVEPQQSAINTRTVLAFLIGSLAPIPFRVVGLLYGTEALFLGVGAWVLITKISKRSYWSPIATRFIALLIVGLASYIVTDLVRGTPSEDYLRGWSKILFILTNFVALYYLTKNNYFAFIAFFLASDIAGIVYAEVGPVSYHNDYYAIYKNQIAVPITIGCMCLLALNKTLAVRLCPYLLIGLGILHMFLDYRTLAAICFLVAAMLFSVRAKAGVLRVRLGTLSVAVVAACVVLAGLYIYSQDKFRNRRETSNSWRFGVTIATLKGIARSPIIGNGSWSTDEEMEGWRDAAIGVSHLWHDLQPFTAHSQILESWYEGGFLAGTFFFYYGFQLAVVLKVLIQRPVDHLSALFVFVTIDAMWNYFCTPLNGSARLDLAAAMAILCYVLAERRTAQFQPAMRGNRRLLAFHAARGTHSVPQPRMMPNASP